MKFTSPWLLALRIAGILLVIALVYFGLLVIVGKMPTAERAKLLLEVAKTLIQVITTIIIGFGLVEFLLKSFDRSRRKDKALHEFRLDFLKRLEDAHENAETSRRDLRAAGLTTKFGGNILAMNRELETAYRDAMTAVTDTQLILERLELELGHFPTSFELHDQLKAALRRMHDYLENVLVEYEKYSPDLRKAPNEVAFKTLTCLDDFTSAPKQGQYLNVFEVSYDSALALIRKQLLPLDMVLSEAPGAPPIDGAK
jgi:multisubunit Na+/H+ antiporter MnhC subunit